MSSRLCVRGIASPSSSSSAFRYFSAHCWQWKHTPSCRGVLLRLLCRAMTQSTSAFRTHSFVVRFIEHFAFGHNLPEKRIPLFETPLQSSRSADDDVQRERRLDRPVDLVCLLEVVPP